MSATPSRSDRSVGIEDRLAHCAEQIWNPDKAQLLGWLRARLHETLGEAAIDAAIRIAALHTTPDSLLADLGDGIPHADETEDNDKEIWITESTLGGTGAVEAISQRVTDDPARFMVTCPSITRPG